MIVGTVQQQMAKTVRYVKPTPYKSAEGLTAELYRQMQTDFMPVPPFTLHSPVPEIMAGVWSITRETLNTGNVDRAIKEAVSAAVSKTNECPYCVDVHTSVLHATSEHDAASAILRGEYESIRDSRVYAVVQWALATRTPGVDALLTPPFSREDVPELIGTAISFHYINRMVNVFLGETFLPIPPAMKGLAGRLFGATAGKRFVGRSVRPGESLKFLPQAELPDDLSWAASNPTVAGAFAGFAQVVEHAAAFLPEHVRTFVGNRIRAWNGESTGMSRQWVEDAVGEINEDDRAAARLMLLTALASYQVDARVIDEFRSQYPEDAQLIAATAWASFTTARRIGVWVAAPFMTLERER